MQYRNSSLEPLPYQVRSRDYFKTHEPHLWNWFASAQAQADYTEHLRLELLKFTYRLDAQSHPDLLRFADEAKERLGLNIPLTLYQAQQTTELNAALYYMPGEAHLLFSGPVLSLLQPEELKSVIGHELAHYHLWHRDNGEFHITDRLLQALAHDPRAATSHIQTARWYQLYAEIFADRGSFLVTKDLHPIVASLVKIQTGLPAVSAASYLDQAEEIFQRSNVKTDQLTHPEAYIRARALALWSRNHPDADENISAMIEGRSALDDLDLLGQVRVTESTKRLLQHFLSPKWFQTPPVMGHAKRFFSDFVPEPRTAFPAASEFTSLDTKLCDYFCYVLLDFVVADPELDEMPLAAAFETSRALGLETQFEKIAAKELKFKARELKRVKEQAAIMLAQADAPGP
jgi:hypothetical protein